MKRVILNLDWGSCFLKGCVRIQARPAAKYPLQILGALDQGQLVAQRTIQLSGQRSLKATFLEGQMGTEELHTHERAAVNLLVELLARPLRQRFEEWGQEELTFLVNIHTPLHLVDSPMVVGSGVFEVFDETERLVAPAYRSQEEWQDCLKHRGQPRGNLWAHWLSGRLVDALAECGIPSKNLRICFLPESLTCVQDVVGALDINASRQFLVLDVGHFTTDYALVAFHHMGTERMFVRRADSIFATGFQFIEAHGPEAWTNRILEILDTFARAGHSTQGIHGYMDLGIVLVGGGAFGLSKATREAFRGRIQRWALQQELFREGFLEGRRTVYLASPPHLAADFQVLGSGQPSRNLENVSADLYVPSILACGLSDATTGLRVSGDKTLSELQLEWLRRSHEPSVDVHEAPVSGDDPLTQGGRLGNTRSTTRTLKRVVAEGANLETQARKLFDLATERNMDGTFKLSFDVRLGHLQRAIEIGYAPAIVERAAMQLQHGNKIAKRDAMKVLCQYMKLGNVDACYYVGRFHIERAFRGAHPDPGMGVRFLLQAARGNHSGAMELIADCLDRGMGTNHSPDQAVKWRSLAASLRAMQLRKRAEAHTS